jgi:hypothetical protein
MFFFDEISKANAYDHSKQIHFYFKVFCYNVDVYENSVMQLDYIGYAISLRVFSKDDK